MIHILNKGTLRNQYPIRRKTKNRRASLSSKRVLKQDGTMIVFWPPSFGLSVKFLGLSHFILNRLFKMKVKLHPDEITLLKSKQQAVSIMSKAGFKIENYYFGIQDFFTYCMIVVTKDHNSTTG